MAIRTAAEADTDAIAAIYNEGIADRIATFETRARDRSDVAAWFADRLPFLVATSEDGGVMGFARVSPYSDRYVHTNLGEHNVYIARAQQRVEDCVLVERLLGEAADHLPSGAPRT